MSVKQKILLVEDDRNFGSVLKEYLAMNAFDVTLATDGVEGLAKFTGQDFDLCIFDVMMPGMDGFSLAAQVKIIRPGMPFIFLTAKSLKEDIVRGFQHGADDYILKPFDAELLLLKIKAVLYRITVSAEPDVPETYRIGAFTFNPGHRLLTHEHLQVTLSPKEGDLLTQLCLFLNEVMPREHALKKIWGEENYFTARSMDVYIARLRKYFKSDASVEIVNLHQKGFRLYVKNNLGQVK